jgi:hypothetical protein
LFDLNPFVAASGDTMSSPFTQKIRAFLIKINLLHKIAGLEPWTAFVFAFLVGLGLAIWSSLIGVNFFWVKIKIFHTGGIEDRTLSLGFLDQVNYGMWYLFFCPFLFMLISTAYKATGIVTVRSSKFILPFEKLKLSWRAAAVSFVLLFSFVGKNVWVEREDYKSLGLGWVQATTLEDYRAQIYANGPIDLTAAHKRFDQFLLPTKHEYIPSGNIQKVLLVEVDPNLRVKNFWGMIAFIVVTKIWVGLWEALVIYTAALTFLWGKYALANIEATHVISQDKKRYELVWLFRPAFYFISVGILVHLFCIFRFCANAIKGSYGNWDQYWSLLTISPAIVVIVLGCFILSKIHIFTQLEDQTYLPKGITIIMLVWLSSFVYISYLLLGYMHPQDQEVLVMCFKPFAAILQKIFG